MSLFRKRRPAGESGDQAETSEWLMAATGNIPAVPAEPEQAPEPEPQDDDRPDRPNGPWDVSEVPDPGDYLDLGAIRLRPRPGMDLRLEIDEASGQVTTAMVQLGGSAVQLQAFAAPRSMGIWDEIRAEIAEGVTRQGGTADDVPGTFGRELLARVPVHTADGRTAHQPARFTGTDGPRWFLRAVFHGAAAYKAEAAVELEALVREVVVVRGSEAMAPRELLPLRLPRETGAPEPEQEERPSLDPFHRGPEITEIR